jgi:hypothetical protein
LARFVRARQSHRNHVRRCQGNRYRLEARRFLHLALRRGWRLPRVAKGQSDDRSRRQHAGTPSAAG